jgi:DNA repair exonuclease SbcCD nuclease subunit
MLRPLALRTTPLPNKHRKWYHARVTADIRILLLADSHLGFDLPVRPRVERRRRGHDFCANYSRALEPALAGEVDIVVHAGDVFDRPVVAPTVAHQAYASLRRIADRGIPVFIVPGNHERSRLPHARFAAHRLIHVFDRPRTFVADVRGTTLALSGFPYERRNVRARFAELLEDTAWRTQHAARRILCIHHCVEGATVGPQDFTFTTADDVIAARDLPPDFSAVLSGHIHRHQVLTCDLQRRPLCTPVLYPGSVERTAFAEADETKGFMVVRLRVDESAPTLRWEFRPLPARPMLREDVSVSGVTAHCLESMLRSIIAAAPRDAVLTLRVTGALTDEHWHVLSAARMRALVPATMNVEIKPADGIERRRVVATRTGGTSADSAQLSLYEFATRETNFTAW